MCVHACVEIRLTSAIGLCKDEKCVFPKYGHSGRLFVHLLCVMCISSLHVQVLLSTLE